MAIPWLVVAPGLPLSTRMGVALTFHSELEQRESPDELFPTSPVFWALSDVVQGLSAALLRSSSLNLMGLEPIQVGAGTLTV